MALSNTTFSDFGNASSDLFQGIGDLSKAAGDQAEAQNYGLAAALAGENESYTVEATAIKEAQANRAIFQTLSSQQSEVASAGFADSGSAIYLARDSAEQGALEKATLQQQGLVQEDAYKEQQQSYLNMENAADKAASTEKLLAVGSFIGAGIQAVAGMATLT